MRKLNISIVIGALVAVLGAALVFAYGRSVDERIADGRRTVPVLVAAAALNKGTLAQDIGEGVAVKDVPQAYVPADALRDLASVQNLELLGPVPVGGQLSRGMFGSSQGADVVRPAKGSVALAISVGITPGVARYVSSGSIVDMFVTYSGGAGAGRTKLFDSQVKVLSVTVAPPAGAAEGEGGGQDAGQVLAVLEVVPDQAERIINATTLGSVYLALSTAGEEHKTGAGATPADVVATTR